MPYAFILDQLDNSIMVECVKKWSCIRVACNQALEEGAALRPDNPLSWTNAATF